MNVSFSRVNTANASGFALHDCLQNGVPNLYKKIFIFKYFSCYIFIFLFFGISKVMAIFRICIAQQIPLDVDLPEKDLAALARSMATTNHKLIGTMAEPDENGVCRKVMIPAARILCVFELD